MHRLVESVPLFVARCSEVGVLIYAGKSEGEEGREAARRTGRLEGGREPHTGGVHGSTSIGEESGTAGVVAGRQHRTFKGLLAMTYNKPEHKDLWFYYKIL